MAARLKVYSEEIAPQPFSSIKTIFFYLYKGVGQRLSMQCWHRNIPAA
jgi:hypothetical protein